MTFLVTFGASNSSYNELHEIYDETRTMYMDIISKGVVWKDNKKFDNNLYVLRYLIKNTYGSESKETLCSIFKNYLIYHPDVCEIKDNKIKNYRSSTIRMNDSGNIDNITYMSLVNFSAYFAVLKLKLPGLLGQKTIIKQQLPLEVSDCYVNTNNRISTYFIRDKAIMKILKTKSKNQTNCTDNRDYVINFLSSILDEIELNMKKKSLNDIK
ncbi:hypothetical protein GQ473_05345 [archaeon]|nr:hypothetical protein [archaeon]